LAGVDHGPGLGEHPEDAAALGRANLVLHFHGLDHDHTLPRLDFLLLLDQPLHAVNLHHKLH
jgi:hypothetical protein